VTNDFQHDTNVSKIVIGFETSMHTQHDPVNSLCENLPG